MVDIKAAMAGMEAFRAVRGAFGGGETTKIEQQTSQDLVPSLDDEAIQASLDAALEKLYLNDKYLAEIRKVRAALEPHQLERWRKVIGKITLTEKFANVVVSEKTTEPVGTVSATDDQDGQNALSMRKRQGSDQEDNQNARNQRQSARRPQAKTSEVHYKRERIDYELTVDDPRIVHLVLVAKIVKNGGVEAAKKYLLGDDKDGKGGFLIHDKSVPQRVLDAAKQAQEKALSGTYHVIASIQLGDKYDTIKAMPEGEAKDRALAETLTDKRQDKKAELAALRAAGLGKKFWVTVVLGVLFIAAGIVFLTPFPFSI